MIYPDATLEDDTDNPHRQYHYEDKRFPNTLTGITDERNIRYANFEYDAEGRAIVSYHGPQTSVLTDQIDGVSITYYADGTRVVADSNGHASTYTTTSQLGEPLITNVTGPACAECGSSNTSYEYDPANNNLLSKTENGIATEYGNYDTNGNYGYKIEAVGTPEERRTDYLYDLRFHNKISSITEPSVYPGNLKTTTYDYDDYGNRTLVQVNGYDPNGAAISRETRYEYNGPLHQLSRIDGPLDNTPVPDVTVFNYYPNEATEGSNRARLKEIIDAKSTKVRSNIQHSATGKVASEERPNNLRLIYTYYPGNDRLESVTETDTATGTSRTTHWTYLATGEVETITQGYGTPDKTTITFGYDDARRLVRITDGLGNYIKYSLDTEGNKEGEDIFDSGNALKKSLTQTFDLYNRLDTSSQANEAVDYHFSPNGTLDTVTDGKDSVTDYDYDSLKRLTTVNQDMGGADPTTQNALTQYGYDAQDNLTSVTDPINGNTTYVYDDLGNFISQDSPDTGSTTFTYDAAGNLKAKLDAKGQTFGYDYDALNRLTLLDAPGIADDINYVYDTCANGMGRLCVVTLGQATATPIEITYSYSAFGEVTDHQSMAYGYNDAGRISRITYPSGAVVTYKYDAAGQAYRVELNQGGQITVLADNISHHPFGPVNNLSYGNGLTLNQVVDNAYRFVDINAGLALDLTGAQYDANGNLSNRSNDTVAELFGYDALNRLDTASGDFGSRNYDYDKNGNRTQLVADSVPTSYGYTPQSNRITNATGWTYTLDANGNTTTKLDAKDEGRLFDYNSHNRLISVTDRQIKMIGKGKNKTPTPVDTPLATYGYNGLGQRVSKTVDSSTTQFVYGLNGELLAKLDGSGAVQREYIYLNGQPLAVMDITEQATPPPASEEVIIDDGDAGTSGIGTWTANSDRKGKDYNGDYLLADGGTGSTYRWTPTLSGGAYDVYVWYIANRKYSNSVPYSVNHNGVIESVTIDQSTSGSQWVHIGSFDFSGDGTEYVEVSDANGLTVADAVRFVKQVTQEPPTLVTSLYYVHNDHLGTPQSLSDESGAVVWKASYDPFGAATLDVETVSLNLRFPGQYYDGETGLHYNYFRTYDPSTGRYITSDPIGVIKRSADPRLPDYNKPVFPRLDLLGGLNHTYAYTRNNPIVFSDPRGLDAPGCDGVPDCIDNECRLECCAEHDRCYAVNNCTASSWIGGSKACTECNAAAVQCLKKCGFSGTGDPNTPDYYCAKQRRFVTIPGDFPDLASAIKACSS